MAVIDDHFYHYNALEGSLRKYPITYLLGKHKEGKYMIRGEKMFAIKPKHQEEWRKRNRHVTDKELNIGCIYVGQRYIKLRWDDICTNLCPCMDCIGSWVPQLKLGDNLNNKSVRTRS